MRRSLVIALVAAVCAALCVGFTTATAAPSAGRAPDRLDVYTAVVQADELPAISDLGIEVSDPRPVEGGIELDMVLDGEQADKLRGRGVELKLTRVEGGQTVQQFAAAQAANGFNVWRSYDEPGGIRDQLYAAARENPKLVKLEVIGHTGQGREIIAVKLTQDARGTRDGKRPAVLYSATQHAREWISTEVDRRLMNHYISGGGPTTTTSASSSRRPSSGSSSSPTRTATSTRSTTSGCGARTSATTTVTGRPRSATASTPTATSPTTGATTRRARRPSSPARPTAARRRCPSRRPGPWSACSTGSGSPSRSTTTRPASGCSIRRAGRPAPRPRTTRSTTPCPATWTPRRSPISTRG